MLDRIAYIDVRDHQALNALHLATRHGQRNVILRLLRAGASLYIGSGGQNWRPLFYAIENGHTEIVTLLIAAGAPLRNMDHSGLTAVYVATNQQHEEIMRRLLTLTEHGVSVNARNSFGGTALIRAAYLGNLEIVDMLLDAGADPNILTKQGVSAIGYASNHDIIQRLRAAGAN